MAKPFRERADQLLTGEKRREPSVQKQGWARESLERFLAGGRSDDPLHISNRPVRKKVLLAAAVVVPFLGVAGVVLLSVLGYFTPKTAPVVLTPAEVAQKMLPYLDNAKLPNESEIEVLDIHFERGTDPYVTGTLKNHSGHTIHSGHVLFDLSNGAGSQVGRFRTELANLAPDATVFFRAPIKNRSAAFALVREVSTK